MSQPKNIAIVVSLLGLLLSSNLRAEMSEDLAALQHQWANAYYVVADKKKEKAFEALTTQSENFARQYPDAAEPLVWEAIVLSSDAKFNGGLSALGKIKKARELLLSAEQIDSNALDGSIYASLGSLYANVPGWPIAYGDKKKAREYLEKALQMNPDGIDSNFFYAELMQKLGDHAVARKHFEKALAAPPRPGREDADQGRRAEIEAALKQPLR